MKCFVRCVVNSKPLPSKHRDVSPGRSISTLARAVDSQQALRKVNDLPPPVKLTTCARAALPPPSSSAAPADIAPATPRPNNSRLHYKVQFGYASSNAGSLLLREAMDRTGLIAVLAEWLHDPRDQRQVGRFLDELLRPLDHVP